MPSPLAVGVLVKCTLPVAVPVGAMVDTAVVTAVDAAVDTAATVALFNTVRAERSEDRHRVTPTGVLRARAWGMRTRHGHAPDGSHGADASEQQERRDPGDARAGAHDDDVVCVRRALRRGRGRGKARV